MLRLPEPCLLVFLLAAISLSSAQSSLTELRQLELKHKCNGMIGARTAALRNHQWQSLIDLSRQEWTECNTVESEKDRADLLSTMGIGMLELREYEDAVPILRRCIAYDRDAAMCWEELGEAYLNLENRKEAEEAFRSAIQVGGYDELNASAIEAAKKALEYMRASQKQPASTSPTPSVKHTYGTAFFVTGDGYLLTNDHVTANCKMIATRQHGTLLQVVARNAPADLALLKSNESPPEVATFRSGPPPRKGDMVIAFGYPLVDVLSSEGNVSAGILSATAGLQDDIRYIQISAPVQPGNSGGPLLDGSGHVIGVVVAKLDTLKVGPRLQEMCPKMLISPCIGHKSVLSLTNRKYITKAPRLFDPQVQLTSPQLPRRCPCR